MQKQLHFFFSAWVRSSREGNVMVTIMDGAKVIVEQCVAASSIIDMVNAIDFVGVASITVTSLTSKIKGKPEVVYYGIVYNEAKRAIAEYK